MKTGAGPDRAISTEAVLRLPASGLFVTGTDTGIGKTHVGCALLAELTQHWPVVPRKPAESGCTIRNATNDPENRWGPGTLFPEDADRLARAARLPDARCHEVNRFRYRTACAPDQAAEREGPALYLADVVDACRVAAGEIPFIEGAGGYYSPLTNDGALNADLADILDLSILIVAPDRLGIQGQLLLLVEAAQRRKRPIAGIVLNRLPGLDHESGNARSQTPPFRPDNVGVLQKRTGLAIVRFPFEGRVEIV